MPIPLSSGSLEQLNDPALAPTFRAALILQLIGRKQPHLVLSDPF